MRSTSLVAAKAGPAGAVAKRACAVGDGSLRKWVRPMLARGRNGVAAVGRELTADLERRLHRDVGLAIILDVQAGGPAPDSLTSSVWTGNVQIAARLEVPGAELDRMRRARWPPTNATSWSPLAVAVGVASRRISTSPKPPFSPADSAVTPIWCEDHAALELVGRVAPDVVVGLGPPARTPRRRRAASARSAPAAPRARSRRRRCRSRCRRSSGRARSAGPAGRCGSTGPRG